MPRLRKELRASANSVTSLILLLQRLHLNFVVVQLDNESPLYPLLTDRSAQHVGCQKPRVRRETCAIAGYHLRCQIDSSSNLRVFRSSMYVTSRWQSGLGHCRNDGGFVLERKCLTNPRYSERVAICRKSERAAGKDDSFRW